MNRIEDTDAPPALRAVIADGISGLTDAQIEQEASMSQNIVYVGKDVDDERYHGCGNCQK